MCEPEHIAAKSICSDDGSTAGDSSERIGTPPPQKKKKNRSNQSINPSIHRGNGGSGVGSALALEGEEEIGGRGSKEADPGEARAYRRLPMDLHSTPSQLSAGAGFATTTRGRSGGLAGQRAISGGGGGGGVRFRSPLVVVCECAETKPTKEEGGRRADPQSRDDTSRAGRRQVVKRACGGGLGWAEARTAPSPVGVFAAGLGQGFLDKKLFKNEKDIFEF